ncbi:MAG: metal-dependent transcriptional regulator, partial [Egibacteraceae bacterium]
MTTHLIDATEMYLRTVYELEEEGITPIRARLVERLGLSAPAVSETVARLEQDGLMRVAADRTLDLTDLGRQRAVSVMRKHRLAERLLVDVIGLEWEQVHNEACRWEHVISDAVEDRLVELLHSPTTCPHGNPIPGLSQTVAAPAADLVTIAEAAKTGGRATVSRISEKLQGDVTAMRFLSEHGLRPGATAEFSLQAGA